MTTWPLPIFDAPLLRGLDARGREELSAAGSLRRIEAGETVYRRGERRAALFVVAEGAVELEGGRRLGAGESFGEEASIGSGFRTTARCVAAGEVAEVPVAMLRRALVRAGGDGIADRFDRRLRRSATAELLAEVVPALLATDRDALIDAARHRLLSRGEVLYRAGEAARHVWLVIDGMVRRENKDGRAVAHHVRGHRFGEEALSGVARTSTAVAQGPTLLLGVEGDVARALPRTAAEVASLTAGDPWLLVQARSMLVIDVAACVQCGHCVSRCADTHGGEARLVRRGEVMQASVKGEASSWLIVDACHHCDTPACARDCPTGAIEREDSVQIRAELCTGCGACVKACPWDRIELLPRAPAEPSPETPHGGRFSSLAAKCDLCAGRPGGPACVEACPTAAITRVQPSRAIPEVAGLVGERVVGQRTRWRIDGWLALPPALALVVASRRMGWVPGRGVGFALGIAAAVGLLGLLGYAGLKRRAVRGGARRGAYQVHVALGWLVVAAAAGHGGAATGGSSGAALGLSLLAAVGLGALAGLAYRWVPPRLARVQRQAPGPDGYEDRRRRLSDALYGAVSGRSDVVKALFAKVLVPYLRQPLSGLRLAASGRAVEAERRRVQRRIDGVLGGRGRDRVEGLERLVELAVDLRALRAERWWTRILRALPPLHVVVAAVALALLVVHVVEVW